MVPTDETLVQCGGSSLFPMSALSRTTPLSATDVDPDALAMIDAWLANEEGGFWPQDNYRVLHQTDRSLLVVHIADGGSTTLIGTEQQGNEWRYRDLMTGAACPIQVRLDDGLSEVRWRLDPAHELSPTSTRLHLRATGQACSGGTAMGDRLQPPRLTFTEQTVFVILTATRPEGAQTCPGNPEELVTVDLGQALGGRAIVDGRSAAGLITDYIPAS